MDEQITVYLCNGLLLGSENEWITATGNKKAESQKHDILRKDARQKSTFYVISLWQSSIIGKSEIYL